MAFSLPCKSMSPFSKFANCKPTVIRGRLELSEELEQLTDLYIQVHFRNELLKFYKVYCQFSILNVKHLGRDLFIFERVDSVRNM